MKKKDLLILVLAAVIGLGITACPDPNGGDKYENREVSASVQLTITGLNDYNGWQIHANAQHQLDDGTMLYLTATGRAGNTYKNGNYDGHFSEPSKVTEGQAVLKVYTSNEDDHCIAYDGSDQNVKFNVSLTNPDNYGQYESGIITVSFTNGGGSTIFQIEGKAPVSTNGQLTITGLSGYNGLTIYAGTENNNPALHAFESVTQTTYGGTGSGEYNPSSGNVSSNQAVLKVYRLSSQGNNDIYSGYSGSDNNVVFGVSLWNSDGSDQYSGRVTVSFTNGAATGEFKLYNEKEVTTAGRLTITGLSSYNGRLINVTQLPGDEYSFKAYKNVTQYFYGDDPYSFYADYSGYDITGDSVTFNVYQVEYDPDKNGGDHEGYHYSSYTGSDQSIRFNVTIGYDDAPIIDGAITVSFTNGVGNAAFTRFTEEPVNTAGRLTITGLSAYNGYTISVGTVMNEFNDENSYYGLYAYERVVNYLYNNASDHQEGYIDNVVTGGSITLNVYKGAYNDDYSKTLFSGYTGNDQNVKFHVSLGNSDTGDYLSGTVTVSFTNGIAAGTFVLNPED